MKILISGGTGFIGRHFIKHYPQHDYVVICRNIARAKKVLGNHHRFMTSVEELASTESIDVVINLAGEPIVGRRWNATTKQALQESRWRMTDALVNWISQATTKPQCFLSGSAVGFYGIDAQHQFIETDGAITSDFSHQLCQRWEHIARGAEPYCRVILLRTGIVLSADGGALQKMLLPFKLGFGGVIGSGQQQMSWIHLSDYLAALSFLMTAHAAAGPINLTAPEPVTNRRFVKALGRALGRPTVLPMPAVVMQLALGEAATLLLDGQSVLPKALQSLGFEFTYPTIEPALRDLVGKSH